jgi:hypothetical protein
LPIFIAVPELVCRPEARAFVFRRKPRDFAKLQPNLTIALITERSDHAHFRPGKTEQTRRALFTSTEKTEDFNVDEAAVR